MTLPSSAPQLDTSNLDKTSHIMGGAAALISLFLGILVGCMAFLISFIAQYAIANPSMGSAMRFIIQCGFLLMIAIGIIGFVLALRALFCIWKYKTPRILLRSVIGGITNGLAILAVIWLLAIGPSTTTFAKLCGHWTAQSPENIANKIDLQLNSEGKAQITYAFISPQKIQGIWGIVPDKQDTKRKYLILKLDTPTIIGTQQVTAIRWEIDKLDQDILTLRTEDGVETYERVR